MTQAQVDIYKIKKSLQNKIINEVIYKLSSTKHAKVYYSKAYKDLVLSFNFINCKKFILTRSMWKVFKKSINLIDGEFDRKYYI